MKIYENHWKTKIHMLLMRFDIRNTFFESHHHIIPNLTMFDYFIVPRSCILDHFWTVLNHEPWVQVHKNRWKPLKTKVHMILKENNLRNTFFNHMITHNLTMFNYFWLFFDHWKYLKNNNFYIKVINFDQFLKKKLLTENPPYRESP